MLFGKISINDGHKDREIKNVWKKTVKNFTNKLQQTIDKKGLTLSAEKEDPYEKLEKLALLKEKGIISDSEFDAEKTRILESS